jgi:magnesium chelatase subunit I
MSDTTSTVEMESRPVFPFTAIVGQEQMKLALILNVLIKNWWVMIMGDRGTGKSTTVRALVDLYLQWMWLQMILSTHTIRS